MKQSNTAYFPIVDFSCLIIFFNSFTMSVRFWVDDIDFELHNPALYKSWIAEVIAKHGKKMGSINYRFASDASVHDVNVQYLNHDTYTDIITFDYVTGDLISGDILISIDRVGENASSFSVPFEHELSRVLIHGVLHLLGFKDKSDDDARLMRTKEEESIALLEQMKSI